MTSLLAPVKWAQRTDKVYLTVDLRDIKDEKVTWVTPNELKLVCTSNDKPYEFTILFFADINTEESKWNKSGLHLQFILEKKEAGPYWKRLTKEEKKFQNITFDWDKYVDEDEEEEEGRKGLDGFDPSQMRGFGGGEGGDEDDEDDEEEGGPGGKLDDLDEEEDIPVHKKEDLEEEKKQ